MPSEYRIDDRQRVVWTLSSGEVSDRDLLAMYERLRADAGFHGDFDELCDFTRTSEVRITPKAVRRLAQETPFAHETRHAIVAPQAVVYGLARMYQAYTDAAGHDRVRVFTDLQQACDWLGVACDERDDDEAFV